MGAHRNKPTGAEAGWRFLRSETRFENHICRLREDDVELAGGQKIKYAYLERDDAVVIVPVTTKGEIVLLRQYRYTVDEWCLEVPAGGTHDSSDASFEDVARKELREEIGGTARAHERRIFLFRQLALEREVPRVPCDRSGTLL